MSADDNFLSEPNDMCSWLLGKGFGSAMDTHRIKPRTNQQALMELCLQEKEPEHSPKLIELSIPFVEDWYAFMDESWERNKFIGCKLALKSLKYGGLNDLQKKLRESLVSNTMVTYF